MSSLTQSPTRRARVTTAPRRRAKGREVWEETPTWFGQFGKGTVLTVVCALVVVPVWAVVLTSFSTKGSINSAGGLVLVPHGLSCRTTS